MITHVVFHKFPKMSSAQNNNMVEHFSSYSECLQQILRHSRIEVTRRYAHVARKHAGIHYGCEGLKSLVPGGELLRDILP